MIKKNKKKLLLSCAVILLPMIIGLLLWNKLPETMPAHWNSSGTVDGWSSKLVAVFCTPLLLLVVHLICIFITAADPKNHNQNKKAFGLVFWICPLACLFSETVMYSTALGIEFSMDIVMLIVLGLMFIIIGNYLPKCKQNYTIGIKISWTLNNEENWNKTHRFAGKVWVIGGLLFIVCAFLPVDVIPYVLIVLILAIALIPI
ncbi:MAG: SdpI family protein, partial [Ruminococcus sp.]|nr:SdpI family protein [Ruminococcus sp.]